MKPLRIVLLSSLALLSGCGAGVVNHYAPDAPSPLYGGNPCPASATSASGGDPTPYDCIPGGREPKNGG